MQAKTICFFVVILFFLGPIFGLGKSAAQSVPTDSSHVPLTDNLKKLIDDPSHRNSIQTSALDNFAKLVDCSEGTFETMDSILSYPPLNVDPNGYVSSGLLVERGRVTGCGRSLLMNIATAGKNGSNLYIPLISGTTLADPILIRDTFNYVFIAASKKIGDCKKVRFINTEFVDFTGDKNPTAKFQKNGGRPWRENWTINICGQEDLTLPVDYVPNDKGTVISVRALN